MLDGRPPMIAVEQCTACERLIDSSEVPCVLRDKLVCAECHARAKPVCPYCARDLQKAPASKSRCPHCQGQILVRKTQWVYPSIFVTTEQAAEIKKYENSTPAAYGVESKQFGDKKQALRVRFGREPTPEEVIDDLRDDLPATEAQIDYARNVGIPVPPNAKKTTISYHLHAYERLRGEVAGLWIELGATSPISQTEVGAFVVALLEDAVIRRLAAKLKRGNAIDAAFSDAGRKRSAAFARSRWQLGRRR